MPKKTKFLFVTMLLILSLCIFTACGNSTKEDTTPKEDTTNNMMPNETTPDATPNSSDTNTSTTTTGDYDQERSEKLASAILEKIPQIDESMVFILGESAYITVNIPKEDTTSEAKTLKEDIAKVVNDSDSAIKDIYISEDADTYTRIKDSLKDLSNGDVKESFEPFKNLFTRITPSK